MKKSTKPAVEKKLKVVAVAPKKTVLEATPEELPVMAAKEVAAIQEEVVRTAPKVKETEEEKSQRIITSTVRAVVGELVPALMAVQNASSSGTRGRPVRRFVQCRICKQAGPDKPPCNDQHIKMVVYPVKYPEFGKWFQGCIVNGIRYLSDGRRDRIDIPAACQGQFMKQVADYEENERVTAMGRTANHDSGGISEGGGNRSNQASSAWR